MSVTSETSVTPTRETGGVSMDQVMVKVIQLAGQLLAGSL